MNGVEPSWTLSRRCNGRGLRVILTRSDSSVPIHGAGGALLCAGVKLARFPPSSTAEAKLARDREAAPALGASAAPLPPDDGTATGMNPSLQFTDKPRDPTPAEEPKSTDIPHGN